MSIPVAPLEAVTWTVVLGRLCSVYISLLLVLLSVQDCCTLDAPCDTQALAAFAHQQDRVPEHSDLFASRETWWNSSITYFMVVDSGLHAESTRKGSHNENDTDTLVELSPTGSLYLTAAGVYCIPDLLERQEVNSLLGDILGIDLTLTFTLNNDGLVVMTVGNSSGALVGSWRVRDSMVYMVQGTLTNDDLITDDLMGYMTKPTWNTSLGSRATTVVDHADLDTSLHNMTDCAVNSQYYTPGYVLPVNTTAAAERALDTILESLQCLRDAATNNGTSPSSGDSPSTMSPTTGNGTDVNSSDHTLAAIVGVSVAAGVLLLLLLCGMVAFAFQRRTAKPAIQDASSSIKTGDTAGQKTEPTDFEDHIIPGVAEEDVPCAMFAPLDSFSRGNSGIRMSMDFGLNTSGPTNDAVQRNLPLRRSVDLSLPRQSQSLDLPGGSMRSPGPYVGLDMGQSARAAVLDSWQTLFASRTSMDSCQSSPIRTSIDATGTPGMTGGAMLRKTSSSESYGSVSKVSVEAEICASQLTVFETEEGELEVLGIGGYGVVYRGMLNDVQPVAIKVATTRNGDEVPEHERFRLIKEIGNLRSCRDPNIVQFLGVCFHEDQLMLVTEFMEGGDLFQALTGPDKEEYMWAKRGTGIAINIVRGLCYLHKNKLIHCDLKPHNILLDGKGNAKIADLGMSNCSMSNGYETDVDGIGTYVWAAPEILLNQKVSEKSDIYSLGIILWQLVTGEVPSRGRIDLTLLSGNCDEAVVKVIAACMSVLAERRPTAKQVYNALHRLVQTKAVAQATATSDRV